MTYRLNKIPITRYIYNKVIIKGVLTLYIHDPQPYLGDEVLVTRVVRCDDGEDVPVVLLHDVQDDRSLLLNGGAKLKEHGVVVLATAEKQRQSVNGYATSYGAGLDFNLAGIAHRGERPRLKGQWRVL